MLEIGRKNSYLYKERYDKGLRCIYALKSRHGSRFYYVGKTKRPTIRFNQHYRCDLMAVPVAVKKWINLIGQENLRMVILMQVSESEAEVVEAFTIQHLFKQGEPLLNVQLKNKGNYILDSLK